MIDILDAGLRSALQAALGHDSPFSPEELATVRDLRVVGAADIADLRRCTGLQSLHLVACEVRSLEPLSALSALSVLHVLACPIEDVSALAGNAALAELQVDFSFVQDLTPLLGLPALRRGRFLGNPLDPASRAGIRARSQAAPRSGSARPPVIELGPTLAWETTRLLWDNQIRLCFGVLDGFRSVLVRPGRSRVDGVELEASRATRAGVLRSVERGTTTDALMATVASFWERKGEPRPTDFTSHRVLGDRIDAESWIEAAPESDRDGLRRFVRRFPELTFYREDSAMFVAISALAGVECPTELAASRAVLAGVLPDDDPRFRLGSFAGPAPRAGNLPQIWYVPAPGVYSTEERKQLLRDQARLFPIAEWIETGRSFLAGAISSTDPAIYEFGEQDLHDAVHDGRPIAGSVYRVFRSHAELLAHIAAFKLPDGTVIEALPDDAAGEGAQD